ncbi:MAG: ABC transporter ATP-binding protein [Candidatus Thermoplasmatota archaeon]|nr:ABC transporter ATP-binding protein [Euryarchaeota archaeon]MEC9090680.1 ABC transporter ATP-binding protein [Candidatus Thermoplasmatota archaeon]MED5486823.1 ABC transporter ATP-binding protein [Candidatus Thermoplasmatota archaeon]|tara:strand:+ start:665 stop:1360 length:696 start_codon:yes stop_codon:yes gene_type:complete
MTTVLEARDLWKIYESGTNRVEALRKVSLTLGAGEMVAVMGASGCGKTTLLNCLSGLDEISSGDVFIHGRSLSQISDADLTSIRGTELGFIFQSFNLLPVLTAVENVELPLLMAGQPPSAARQTAMEALAAVGLEDRAGHLPAELSGGQQQRVTIARSFVHNPAVIFADEATGNLDSKTSDEIIDLLLRLNNERKVTMMLVTHDPEIAERCSRVLIMQDGRIIEDRRNEEE